MTKRIWGVAAGVGLAALAVAGLQPATAADRVPTKHVLLVSVDGLHQSDLAAYVAAHPTSALASLVHNGTEYTRAQTTFPSDSFPGMIAQLTGAKPATAGVFYDDTYNRNLLAPGTRDCVTAPRGTEVSWTEAADRSQNPITLDAGQQIADPALTNLPTNTKAQTLANAPAIGHAILTMTPTPQSLLDPAALPVDPATCTPVYPHKYVKVNSVFNVAHQAHLLTAWSDKHAAYEILNGPSGNGINDLFTPEINSAADVSGDDWTTNNALTQEYDGFKVAAVLNEIGGMDHSGTRHVGVPAIFGMNFQSVSTAEKLPTSNGLAGGYLPNGAPGPVLSNALDFVDHQVGSMLAAIHQAHLDKSTTIILSAKHAQSPIARADLRRVNDGAIIDGINADWASSHPTAAPLVAFSVDDDGMLLWLSDRSPAALTMVKQYLLGHTAPANVDGDPKGTNSATVATSGLTSVYTGAGADKYVGANVGNDRVPDVIGIAQHGVVFTGGVKKIAEHGGASAEDRNVPLIISGAGVRHGLTNGHTVQTTQIAPTILRLLGLDPQALDGVRIDHTAALR